MLLFVVACSSGEKYSVQKLPNGKEIKISSIGKAHFSESDPALIIKYETDLDIENVDALKTEVSEIWPVFKHNAEQAGLTNAVIQATKTTKKNAFMSSAKNYGFVYKKQDSGEWVLSENP